MARPIASAIPARFSIAHGGKDRHPFPVPLKVYDRTIAVLKTAVQKAKLGASEELAAIKRLDEQARRLEGNVSRTFGRERCSPRNATARTAMAVEAFLAPEPAPDENAREGALATPAVGVTTAGPLRRRAPP